jgi:hypothetical protein
MVFLRSYADPFLAKDGRTQKCEKSEIPRERTNEIALECADERSSQNELMSVGKLEVENEN